MARTFLESIVSPNDITDKVCSLTREHMSIPTTRPGVSRLANRLQDRVEMLALLMEADTTGRISKSENRVLKPLGRISKMVEMANDLGVVDDGPKPIMLGRHLISLGMKPGKEFGDILCAAFEAQMNEDFTDVEGGMQWLQQYIN